METKPPKNYQECLTTGLPPGCEYLQCPHNAIPLRAISPFGIFDALRRKSIPFQDFVARLDSVIADFEELDIEGIITRIAKLHHNASFTVRDRKGTSPYTAQELATMGEKWKVKFDPKTMQELRNYEENHPHLGRLKTREIGAGDDLEATREYLRRRLELFTSLVSLEAEALHASLKRYKGRRCGRQDHKPRGETYTLDEIGKDENLTRERIRQIEAKTVRALKDNKELRSLVES